MKKRLVYSISAVGMLSMALAGGASARGVSASSGSARVGGQEPCFNSDPLTGAVTSTCNADFLVPLTADTPGAKAVTYTRRATAAGAACRIMTNNRFGTAPAGTAFNPVPVSVPFLTFTFGAVIVPAQGVLFAHCVTNPGTAVNEFDYSP